jgi:hypothetical protein
MTCSHFHGHLRRNAVTILQATRSRPYKPCTLDLLLPHRNTPLLRSLHSTFSLGPSYRVLTNSSLSLTASGQMMLVSGTSFELHSRGPYPGTLHASKTEVFWLNSTPAINPTHVMMVNQHFWLQYHTISELQSPLSSTDTHLIRPCDSSDDFATCHKLLPFQKWLNLTHQDMFIHGLFDFASINGRKTQDRISQSDWDILKTHCNMFHNPLPCFDIPSYSIHVDRRAHVSYHDAAIANQLLISGTLCVDTPGPLTSFFYRIQMCLLEL